MYKVKQLIQEPQTKNSGEKNFTNIDKLFRQENKNVRKKKENKAMNILCRGGRETTDGGKVKRGRKGKSRKRRKRRQEKRVRIRKE
jgi:hypothetical protein